MFVTWGGEGIQKLCMFCTYEKMAKMVNDFWENQNLDVICWFKNLLCINLSLMT